MILDTESLVDGRWAMYTAAPNIRLYNCEIDTRISSGDVVFLHTYDPEKLPLPNIEMLRCNGFFME